MHRARFALTSNVQEVLCTPGYSSSLLLNNLLAQPVPGLSLCLSWQPQRKGGRGDKIWLSQPKATALPDDDAHQHKKVKHVPVVETTNIIGSEFVTLMAIIKDLMMSNLNCSTSCRLC